MASSGDTGGCNSKRRRQPGGCADDGGETSGRSGKRYGAAPSPVDIDGAVSGGRVLETADDDEDGMYDFDDCDDEDIDIVQDDAPACDKEQQQRYVVLTEGALRTRQAADTAAVAEVLQIPAGFAAVLLRHFKWCVGRVQEDWFSDGRRVRGAVGLPADGALVPAARSPWPRVCGVCFDAYPAGGTASTGCDHYYCDGCWRGYIRTAVGNGVRCLSLRCPDPSCPAPVVRELVDEVLVGGGSSEEAHRYALFWLRSYVEESGGRVRWCPGRGCTLAVEFVAGDDDEVVDVFCSNGHGFCWRCGEEAHRPVSCGTVCAWLAKNESDSETANWVLSNTKLCPRCRRPIEKNQGCNHMTCSAPCYHQFCWLCSDPWNDHKGCSRYGYRRQRQEVDGQQGEAGRKDETLRRQAKASLDRYLFHYERWAGNHRSLQQALEDIDQLERSELERMAQAMDLPVTEFGFVTEAYRQVADGRRVLRWAHAYGYFLDLEQDAVKCGLFDDLQSQADRWLERLHGCAELERKELFGATNGEFATVAEMFTVYREKLANLTRVACKFLRNLVKAIETDMPEVVKPATLVPKYVKIWEVKCFFVLISSIYIYINTSIQLCSEIQTDCLMLKLCIKW
jgi:ariadne-1